MVTRSCYKTYQIIQTMISLNLTHGWLSLEFAISVYLSVCLFPSPPPFQGASEQCRKLMEENAQLTRGNRSAAASDVDNEDEKKALQVGQLFNCFILLHKLRAHINTVMLDKPNIQEIVES